MENVKTDIFKTNTGSKLYVKSILVIAVLLVMILIELFKNGSYCDEIIGVIAIFYMLFWRRKIERYDLTTIALIIFAVLIGILSNLISGLVSSAFSIGTDIIVETKLIFGFFFVKYFLSNREKQQVINLLTPLARLWCLVSTATGIISQVVNTDMTGEIRLGFIKTFNFLFTFNFQYTSVYMLAFGIIICSTVLNEKTRKRYIIIGLIGIFLAAKSPSIIFTLVFLSFLYNFNQQKKVNPFIVVIAVIVIVVAGWYQISTYLLEEGTPRRMFFEYGIKTANRYFPLGSGFSTFGSGEAASHYSPLYYEYGFENLWGMSPDDTAFLNDAFWASTIGQFGWIGSIIYLTVFIRVLLIVRKKDYEPTRKAFIYAAFLQYFFHAIGSAILSSSAGMIGFMALGLFINNYYEDEKEKKVKQRLRLKLK